MKIVKNWLQSSLSHATCTATLWGALPTCPRCKVAKLKVAYRSLQGHNGQGDWTCRGSWDKDIGTLVPCFFRAAPGGVTRDPWRDVDDPAPKPEVERPRTLTPPDQYIFVAERRLVSNLALIK
jgi:hypothetical protein